MEKQTPNQSQLLDKLKIFFRNKNNIFFSVGFLLLTTIIVLMAVFITQDAVTPKVTNTPTPRPTTSTIQQVTTTQPNPVVTISQSERSLLETQTKPTIDQRVEGVYSVIKVKAYMGNWTIMRLTTPDNNDGFVVARKENGVWVVKLGPGTFFDEESLNAIGAPVDLKNDINMGI